MKNRKSDIPAKQAFVKKLNAEGFQAKEESTPTDVVATKDGVTWYFEIKMTRHDDRYFGAATSTEWRQAFLDPEHFRFVVAIVDDDDNVLRFIEYTPAEFMEFSTIPPFKVYFNIDFTGKRKKSTRETKSIPLTREIFQFLDRCFEKVKPSKD